MEALHAIEVEALEARFCPPMFYAHQKLEKLEKYLECYILLCRAAPSHQRERMESRIEYLRSVVCLIGGIRRRMKTLRFVHHCGRTCWCPSADDELRNLNYDLCILHEAGEYLNILASDHSPFNYTDIRRQLQRVVIFISQKQRNDCGCSVCV
jgi:hypothetical protein